MITKQQAEQLIEQLKKDHVYHERLSLDCIEDWLQKQVPGPAKPHCGFCGDTGQWWASTGSIKPLPCPNGCKGVAP